jgi:hypothetical protein
VGGVVEEVEWVSWVGYCSKEMWINFIVQMCRICSVRGGFIRRGYGVWLLSCGWDSMIDCGRGSVRLQERVW